MEQKNFFKLELITPEQVVIHQEVSSAIIPTVQGPIGILPGHVPLLGVGAIGVLKAYDTSNKLFQAFVESGFFMITREGVTIIARDAELQDQIDVEEAYAEKGRAQKILLSTQSAEIKEQAREDLLRAETKITLARGAD